MNFLPRLLYLFQALPIHVPRMFLRHVTSIILKFVWSDKPARIARSILYRSKALGGLGVPHILHYYVASHLTRVVDWHRNTSSKLWVSLEAAFSAIPLCSLPWLSPSSRPPLSHPTLSPTLKICEAFVSSSHLAPTPSPLFPVLGNPGFAPSITDPVFRRWRGAGRSSACSFLAGSSWLSPTALQDITEPCSLGVWRVNQLSHFLSSLPPPETFTRARTPFECLCTDEGPSRHVLSSIYSLLGSPPDLPPPPFVSDWEADLGLSLSPEQCSSMFSWAHASSISNCYQEAGYKLLSRWYQVPTRLHRIFPSISPLCWRGCGARGSILHIFWECPYLTSFWQEVWRICSTFTTRTIPFTPGFFLLHLSDFPAAAYKHSVLRYLLIAARACIPALWKSPDPPSIQMWLHRVGEIYRMEDLTATIHNQQKRFSTIWSPWQVFSESHDYASLMRT